MTGFDAKRNFQREMVKSWRKAVFNLKKQIKTHFSRKSCIPRVYLMQNAFFSKKWWNSAKRCCQQKIERNSPLYGRESKVTILVGHHFQSGMLPFERASKKTWLGHTFVRNWRPKQQCTFLAGVPNPPQGRFYDSGLKGGTKISPK